MEKAEEATAKWAAREAKREDGGGGKEDELHSEYVFLGRESEQFGYSYCCLSPAVSLSLSAASCGDTLQQVLNSLA